MAHFLKFRRKTIAITSLFAEGRYGNRNSDALYIGGGVYKKSSKSDRMEWTGESWGGEIPYDELLKWAFHKGYIAYGDGR